MSKSVIPKKLEFHVQYNPNVPPSTWLSEQLQAWMKQHEIKVANIFIVEEQEWDIAPMRKFFHGVILPAFVAKYNGSTDRPKHRIFDKVIVKSFLKAKFIGWVKDAYYQKWEKPLQLEHRPSDMLDFCELTDMLLTIKDSPQIESTASLSPERYWIFINACEAYYLAEFHDMFDVRLKPQDPGSSS